MTIISFGVFMKCSCYEEKKRTPTLQYMPCLWRAYRHRKPKKCEY